MNYSERLTHMVREDMTMGDIVVADNIYAEHKKGVSLEDLAVKYDKSAENIKLILSKFEEKE